MEIISYYGKVTESKARAIVRDLNLGQHESDENVYTYMRSTEYPNLFNIVALPPEDSYYD